MPGREQRSTTFEAIGLTPLGGRTKGEWGAEEHGVEAIGLTPLGGRTKGRVGGGTGGVTPEAITFTLGHFIGDRLYHETDVPGIVFTTRLMCWRSSLPQG